VWLENHGILNKQKNANWLGLSRFLEAYPNLRQKRFSANSGI
jgi:hypothetical protein